MQWIVNQGETEPAAKIRTILDFCRSLKALWLVSNCGERLKDLFRLPGVSYHQLMSDSSQIRCLHVYCFGEFASVMFLKHKHLWIAVLDLHLLVLSYSQLFSEKLLYSLLFKTSFTHNLHIPSNASIVNRNDRKRSKFTLP